MALHGCRDIARVVDVFQLGAPSPCPFAYFKIKVLERQNGSFLAVPNVARLGTDGSPDWISGLGDSADAAMQDAIKCFVESVGDSDDLPDAEFEWSDPTALAQRSLRSPRLTVTHGFA